MAKRGRKPSGIKKGYFYSAQEEALVNYIKTQNEEDKDNIYRTILKPAFEKMISSIIRRYHLYVPDEEYEQTYNDTLSYLLTKIGNFKPEKGCKAYSYCGTVARNYLMFKNNQYSKKILRNLPYDDMCEDITNDLNYSYSDETTFRSEAPELIKNTAAEIKKMIDKAEEYQLNEDEIKVGYALYELMNNWEEFLPDNSSNKMNKSSVLYFLRETTMMTTKEIRDNMKKYKKIYLLLRDAALQ